MAAGKRPVPFRTRKLSPPAPMVLPPGGSGRVGYRRPNNFTHRHPPHNRSCGGCLSSYAHPSDCRLRGLLRGYPHCGQHHPHPSLVRAHGLYESTQHPHRRNTHLGKRGGVVDSCTTSAPHDLLVAPLTHTDLRIADNNSVTHCWSAPTNQLAAHRGLAKLENSCYAVVSSNTVVSIE